jgi:hypothetical protein
MVRTSTPRTSVLGGPATVDAPHIAHSGKPLDRYFRAAYGGPVIAISATEAVPSFCR